MHAIERHCCVDGSGTLASTWRRVQTVWASSLNAARRRRGGRRGDANFVVASTEVLDERVTAHDHPGVPASLQASHRPQRCP